MNFELQYLHRIALLTSILGIVAFISDFGYSQSTEFQQLLDGFYFVALGIGVISVSYTHLTLPTSDLV